MTDSVLVLLLILVILILVLIVVLLLYSMHVNRGRKSNYRGSSSFRKKFGFYTLFKQIGRGGMADIYAARKKNAGQPVAIKVLKPSNAKDKESVSRFLAEAESMRKINMKYPASPVVKIHEYGRETITGQYYIAMEYLPGKNLKVTLESQIPIHLDYKIRIIKEVAKALRDSHDLSIIHRDITPENIIVNGERITLIDFGIAKEQISRVNTLPGIVLGKPLYLSPEQCKGGRITSKSDIYSLGAVFYYMIEGKPPFNSTNPYDIIKKHLERPVPEMKTPVPHELKNFIYRMLEKKPENRPDAREVIGMMRQFLKQGKSNHYESIDN